MTALATFAVAICVLGGSAAAKPKDDVEQLTTTLPTLNPGQTAWVSTLWRGATDSDANSFELHASAPGLTIGYPENTGSYSSLYKQSTLLSEDTDYASLKVKVGDHVLGNQTIELTVTYRLKHGNGSDNGGKPTTRHLQVTLPVVEASGATVEQVTSAVGPIKAGAAAWVSVAYRANKPGVTGARLTVQPPDGASITYPNDGTSTGFAADADLAVGETDSASFKVGTGTLQPGTHQLALDLTYGSGEHLPGTVTLTVQ